MIIVKHIKLSCYECAFIAYSYRIDRSENGDKRLENDYCFFRLCYKSIDSLCVLISMYKSYLLYKRFRNNRKYTQNGA
jgi:hypothetical protein